MHTLPFKNRFAFTSVSFSIALAILAALSSGDLRPGRTEVSS